MARYRAPKDTVDQLRIPNLMEPYENKGLFADHFLKDRLPQLEEWQQVKGVEDAFEAIREMYSSRAARFTQRTNEAQTEHDFIQPVLNLLWREKENDCYQVQVSIPNSEGRRQPDYAFFQTAKERNDAEERKGTLEYFRNAPALGDAKAWSASLDKQRGVHENPSAQICNYLYRSRVRWGILTNGQIWRLYERERSSTGGVFYEIDLEHLLAHHDIEAFKYFYLFFRREAFIPDQKGATFIEKVFQGSVDYATEVGDRLKESVYDALRVLMNGFCEHPANELDRRDSDTLERVHENCLIVLYRMLFLLYAEDRLLLPHKTEPYASYSLYARQQEINQHLRSGETYLPTGRRFWGELMSLFELIDRGSSGANIPAYNGGLFSPSNHPHIAHTPQPDAKRWEIGDRYLAEAVDLLSYERERWDQAGDRHVDYATLDVQHLGSIYEGLLELQPRIAQEPLIETVKDGKPLFRPGSDVANPRLIHGQPPRTVDKGEIYLATDRGERKATGSYYTPKYIVQYIVENTVGPLTEEAEKQVYEMRPDVDKEITKLERKRREWEKSPAPDSAEQVAGFDKLIEDQKRRLLEPYLSLKILDPAMGSGHFLVGAADFLSLAMATDPYLLPMDEVDNEDPQAFYKRLVVERCLYGVDLNVLAVELAKLSLWLHTVSKDKALSFLDHHLRCGNSLIGARIEDDLIQIPPEISAGGRIRKRDADQLILGFSDALIGTHLQHFLGTFRQIMETPTGDAETERKKDKWYREMDSVRDRFRSAANCWLAPYFGVPVSLAQYQRAVKTLHSDTERQALAAEKWFRDAQAVARQKRFFHWELEFPEVFFSAHGFKPDEESGFHAVISNPPYVDIKGLERELTKYLFDSYSTMHLRINIFASFLERALKIAKAKYGQIGFIIPTAFLTQVSYASLRQFILAKCWLRNLVRLPNELFGQSTGDVKVDTCIVIVHSGYMSPDVITNILVYDTFERTNVISGNTASTEFGIAQLDWLNKENSTITLIKPEENHIIYRLKHKSLPLNECCEFCLGITPYDKYSGHTEEQIKNKVFHAKSQIDSMYRKLLTSGDVRRYTVEWNREDWIKYGDWLAAPRKKKFFTQERILVQQIIDWTSLRIFAGWTDEELYNTQNQFNLLARKGTNLKFILAILNSSLMTYYHRRIFLDVALQRFQKVLIKDAKSFPIPQIKFTTPAEELTLYNEEGKNLYEDQLSNGDRGQILQFIEHQLAQTPERADVIHNLLAFLAERMIEMNKEKQAEVRGFLKWLERYIGAEVDDLKNKTKLRAYHEHDLPVLLDVLRQNRRKLGVDPAARDVQEHVEKEFNNSMTKLTPLKGKIAATDRLINLIVYQLYGLTDEEIAIVEESM